MKICKILLVISVLSLSCDPKTKDISRVPKGIDLEEVKKSSEAENLLIKHCYPCHGPNTTSHDDIIAPPMVAIKFRYMKHNQDEEEFVRAVVNWSKDPRIENALMKRAVERFGMMPKQEFKIEELKAIAEFIYSIDVEEPLWFESHRNEMHSKKKIR